MTRTPINSPSIISVGYEYGILEIEFDTGEVYQYLDVPEIVYIGLINSSSGVFFFNMFIKDLYINIRVG